MIGRGSLSALSIAAAFGLAACGSGGSDQPVPTVPSTAPGANAAPAAPERVRQSVDFPAKFEQRVNGKCKRAEHDVKAVPKGYTPERFRLIRNAFEDLATDLDGMKPPARNKRAWKRYVAVMHDGADWVGQVESEVADGDILAFNRLRASAGGLDHRMNKLSLRYGFKECADD